MYHAGSGAHTRGRRGLGSPYRVYKSQVVQIIKKLFHKRARWVGYVVRAPKIPTLFARRTFQYVYRPLCVKYLVNKPVLGGHICRWILLFQEYDFEMIVKPRRLYAGLDHLSRIETGEEPSGLEEGLSDTQLFAVRVADDHFADIF